MLHALFVCVGLFIILEMIAHVVLYLRNPGDARTPKDERERLIELKALRSAAYVYVVGSFVAVATLHLGAGVTAIGYGVLLALVLAEVVNCIMRIYYCRRGF